jgi:hypothetical protein
MIARRERSQSVVAVTGEDDQPHLTPHFSTDRSFGETLGVAAWGGQGLRDILPTVW